MSSIHHSTVVPVEVTEPSHTLRIGPFHPHWLSRDIFPSHSESRSTLLFSSSAPLCPVKGWLGFFWIPTTWYTSLKIPPHPDPCRRPGHGKSNVPLQCPDVFTIPRPSVVTSPVPHPTNPSLEGKNSVHWHRSSHRYTLCKTSLLWYRVGPPPLIFFLRWVLVVGSLATGAAMVISPARSGYPVCNPCSRFLRRCRLQLLL